MTPNWLNAYVLHRRPYRETSFLVDFFTYEQGRISAVAKGVRGAKSDKRSLLQPFQALRIQLTGKSDLKNLTLIEAAAPALNVTGDALYCAFYVNELTNRVLPQGLAAEMVYQTYGDTLVQLKESQRLDRPLREFEMALIAELGVIPDMTTEAFSAEPIVAQGWYDFYAEQGFSAVAQAGRNSYSGKDLLSLAAGDYTDSAIKTAKRLTRHVLQPFIGDKPLKSRELFLAGR